MKQKNSKIIPLALLSAIMIPSITSCGGSEFDSNTLKIVVRSAGFGADWVYEVAESFKETHPEVTVDITDDYNANNIIDSHLASSKNDDDLYISVGSEWKSYAARGKFAELDDLLNETVDGVTLREKVADEFENSLNFTKSNGEVHTYRLPWTTGVGGIFYNKKMFEQNKWNVPTTFEELITLCQTILDAEIAVSGSRSDIVVPFAYTGQNTDYFDYTVYNWWAQIVGKTAIDNFLKYESADCYDVTKNETYAALKTATGYWNQIFSNPANYIEGSGSKDAATAQKEFLNGRSAMMFNGDWLYNEILNYDNVGTGNENFELGLMNTPIIPDAKDEYKNTTYIIGEDQFIAIPKTSKRQRLAKDFIKEIVSDKGCQTFVKNANAFLAYDCDYSNAGIEDEFVNDMLTYRNTYTTKFTNASQNRLYLCGYADIWTSSANRPYAGLINGTTSLDASFTKIATYATSNWSDWVRNSQ